MIDNFFTTIFGSDIWGMRHSKSDIDLFRVYVATTEEVLKGTANIRSKFIEEGDTDIALHEIGKVIEQLLKGNMNFIIGVMSPIVVESYNPVLLHELRDIVRENISKNCYHSIHGMAMHNYKKYVESGFDKSERRCNKILRVLKFGQRLLREGKVVFEPVVGGTSKMIEEELKNLEVAYKNSELPEKPNEEPFREWLYNLRLYELKCSDTNRKKMKLKDIDDILRCPVCEAKIRKEMDMEEKNEKVISTCPVCKETTIWTE